MYKCPKCNIPLNRNSSPFGIFWSCPKCSGRAVSLSFLRQSVPAPIVNEFWRVVRTQKYPEKKLCPACKSTMSEVPINIKSDISEYLDICQKCYLIWFDPNEFEYLPQVEIPKQKLEELPYEARVAIAKYEIERIATERENEEESKRIVMNNYKDILLYITLCIIFKKL